MYAVISAGGRQEKVEVGETVRVDLLNAAEGDDVTFSLVMLADGDAVLSTPDELAGASCTGRVLGEVKGPKIDGFTYKNKTNNRRRFGHRQRYTDVEITAITKG
ncbi:MAG: 50S ribosomal protein L21 [Actinomycetia bacterium]|nr:50S ribosomal protein L21 [Actinomycetes bacterium]MCP4958486.1 50S ribosomal protein L21 [Actinomycetes bacterium]